MMNYSPCIFVTTTFLHAFTVSHTVTMPLAAHTKPQFSPFGTTFFVPNIQLTVPPIHIATLPTTVVTLPPAQPHVTDSTTPALVTNHPVNTSTYVTNASSQATQDSTALIIQPVEHPDLNPPRRIPTNVYTPVNIKNFSIALTTHPNQELVAYLINGLKHGFDIGFNKHSPLLSTHTNLKSATDHTHDVTTAICKELVRGHTCGPFATMPIKNLHCSPLGSREKKDGTRRLIMDLSQPDSASVNNGINKDDFSVEYSHFDDAINLVTQSPKNCLMSKIDIKHAFRILPVLPTQWFLLGFFWLGYYFFDTQLPFGLRSSPAIFNRFADAVCWIVQFIFKIKNIIHYSDDFFLVSSPNIATANKDLNTVTSAFKTLGVPISEDKLVGPATSVTYLGITINSTHSIMEIPEEKMNELLQLLPQWLNRKKCKKRDLLSLIGKLSFVCKVVRPGRIFLRRLIDLSTTAKHLHHHIYLNTEARADIQWWIKFLPTSNKQYILPDITPTYSDSLKLYTDASNIGFGAAFGHHWIQSPWPPSTSSKSIDFKEMFAILAAVLTWGHHWPGKTIIILTDNLPITEIWHKGSSPSRDIMSLVRTLYLITARLQFVVKLKHIPGKHNIIADSLSRFQMQKFQEAAPQADQHPTPIPEALWQMTALTT